MNEPAGKRADVSELDLSDKRILIVANAFWPSVGGYETFCAFLAEGLAQQCRVTVVSDTPAPEHAIESQRSFKFEIVRRPLRAQFRMLAREADLVILNSVSLKYLARLIPDRRRVVAIHHTTYQGTGKAWTPALEFVKRLATACVPLNICVSGAVAARIFGARVIIGNPFDSALFFGDEGGRRNKAMLFVGRLVTEKGADLLLNAFQRFDRRSPGWTLTIVGNGPELGRLQELARALGLTRLVTFAGLMTAEQAAVEMRRHGLLVVPSRSEPFGIVALEGLASGCQVIHADVDGLTEACGGFGSTFPPGDVDALCEALVAAADVYGRTAPNDAVLQSDLERHLRQRTRPAVLSQYVWTLSRFISHGRA